MREDTHEFDYEYEEGEPISPELRQILTGVLVGGIIGATAMLFLAPRSGEEMRAGVREKAMDLRDRTSETVRDRFSQVASRAGHLRGDAEERSQELKQRGQDVLVEKLDRVSEALEAVKKVIQEF